MLHLVERTNLIISRRTLLRCGLLFAAVLALLPVSARAQCTNWDASGQWLIFQRGQPEPILLSLEQKGRVIAGRAGYEIKRGFGVHTIGGLVDGTIDGDRVSFQIFWPGNLTGVYNAKILPSGRLDGETHDKNNSKISQTWISGAALKCPPPPVVSQPTPPRPKPLKSTGKAGPREPSPSPPSPPMKGPGIVASQVVFPAPGSPSGFVVLIWDGGPDHPYAEVWVKVDGGDETKVVEQGKGGIQVTVVRGRSYEYILTDAGNTLSTVSFIVPRR